METKEGQETEVAPGTEKTQETKPETPIADVATLQKQLEEARKEREELNKKYEQTEKGLRTAHSTLTEKDRLLKEQADLRSLIASQREDISLILEAIAIRDSNADNPEAATAALKKKLEEKRAKEQQEENQKRYAEFAGKVGEYQKRVDSLIPDKDSEEYLEIRDLVVEGKFERADRKLKKLEGQKTVENKETKPEVKPDERDKTIEELKKELDHLKKQMNGSLDSETGLPSGSSLSDFEAEKAYISGKKRFQDLPESLKRKYR